MKEEHKIKVVNARIHWEKVSTHAEIDILDWAIEMIKNIFPPKEQADKVFIITIEHLIENTVLHIAEIQKKLCDYDSRNPNNSNELGEIPIADVYPNRIDCYCDSCHRGTTFLANTLLAYKESDLVEYREILEEIKAV
jgi:hypothetical protein